MNDAPLQTIDRATASEFLTTISRLHPHWARSAKSKDLSLAELLVKYGQGGEQLSNRTLNRVIGSLSSVFKHARRRGHFDGDNPFAEQTRPKARKGTSEWLPFSDQELKMLFDAQIFRCDANDRLRPRLHTVETAMRSVPLIGLFSGMRLGEFAVFAPPTFSSRAILTSSTSPRAEGMIGASRRRQLPGACPSTLS